MPDILNILIVEDEKPIRDDLAAFPWEDCGAFLVGEASNGQEALEYFEELVPDIVVADISMPVTNGLDLMEQARERFPDTAFIFLTCHADFGYARKALKLGAVDYIMKAGMKDEDLRNAILHAREHIRSTRGFRESVWREELWRRTSEIRSFAMNNAPLPSWLTLPSQLEAIQIVSIRRDAIFVNRFCQRYLEEHRQLGWFSPGTNRLARFTPGTERSSIERIVASVSAESDSQLPYLGGDVRYFGSISAQADNDESARKMILDLDLWRDIAFYEEDQAVFIGSPERLIDLHDIQRDELESLYRLAERSLTSLVSFLREDFAIWAKSHRVKPDHLKSVLYSWRESWKRRFLPGNTNERFWIEVTGVSNLSELISLLSRELESSSGVSQLNDGDLRSELRMARAIVREDFAMPLTLPEVAERVGLSSSYLSRLFKSEIGRSFKEYLTEVRIERAMQLLQTSGMKVYEVAEAVGFPSYRYFSSLFKTLTGQRPKDYQTGQIDAV